MGALLSAVHNQFGRGGVCTSNAQLVGRTIVITGGNAGLGKETAVDLARRGGRVILACRSEERGLQAVEDVKVKSGTENVVYRQLDLASLKSVRDFVAKFIEEEERLDILINNAGVMACPQMKTQDGFELQMGTNHLGHFLLTNLLLDNIKETGPGSRIVNVSSGAHKQGNDIDLHNLMMDSNYSAWKQYGNSKIANILFTKELAKRLSGTGVNTYALHPGVITTELWKNVVSWAMWFLRSSLAQAFMKNVEEGAQTSIYCAVSEEVKDETGLYYADCAAKEPITRAEDKQLAEQLWKLSETLVQL